MSQTSVPDAQGAVFAGVFDPSVPHHIDSFFNEEAATELPFGVLVIQGVADDGALEVVNGTGVPVGVVTHNHRHSQGGISLGDVGLKPTAEMGVLREGKIAVTFETAVAVGDVVRVRHAGVGTIGAFRVGAVSAETVPLDSVEVLKSAGAGEATWIKLIAPLSFGTPDP